MLSIPELASQLINKSLSEAGNDSSRTIFLVGSKSVGKSSLLYSFLEKSDTPKETLVLEYSFGRKSNQKQGIEKTICHVWEYGGKLDILKNVLSSIPIRGKFYYCVMVDISKIKTTWNILETCIQVMKEMYPGNVPELIIICGKYDLFKNYDSEIKKFICTTIRSVALVSNAHLLFYSSREQPLVKRAKDMLHSAGFGNGTLIKEKNTNFTKPLIIPKGTDTWESIGIAASTLQQIKARHISRIAPDPEVVGPPETTAAGPQRSHAEPGLDSLVASKYEELRNFESVDISLNDYLVGLH